MTFAYEDNDVLYVAFARPRSGARYVETDRGDVVRFSEDTSEILGVTVMSFAERTRRGETIEIPEIGAVTYAAAMSALLGPEPVLSKPTF